MNKKCSSTLHPLHPLPAMEVLTTLSIKRGKRKKLIGQRVSLKTEASYMRKCPTYVLLFRRGKKKKKKKRTCFQFVFKFSPFYNSGLCKDSFFCLPINKTISSNFRYLRVLIIVQLFVFWVWICCVRISIMVRFIVTNIRGYTRWSAGLWVGWFLHCFCEKQLHLWEKAKRKPRVLNV